MSWDTYVHQIQNKFDAASGQWSVTNLVQFACVYGLDGAAWATSPGFQLATYEFDMPQGDGTTKKVMCNEHAALLKGAKEGSRKPQECGFRICNQKYTFMKADNEDGIKYVTLSRAGGGGATVAVTSKALLVGVWGKGVERSDKMFQNVGDTEAQVLNVAKILNDAGY